MSADFCLHWYKWSYLFPSQKYLKHQYRARWWNRVECFCKGIISPLFGIWEEFSAWWQRVSCFSCLCKEDNKEKKLTSSTQHIRNQNGVSDFLYDFCKTQEKMSVLKKISPSNRSNDDLDADCSFYQ